MPFPNLTYAARPASLTLLALMLSCSTDETSSPPPTGIRVTAMTSGAELDPDGYWLVLNSANDAPIGVNDSVTRSLLAPGSYAVTLGDVASNCMVAAPSVRTVVVSAGDISSTEFAVTCDSTFGAVRLQVVEGGYIYDSDHLLSLTIDTLPVLHTFSTYDSTLTLKVGSHSVTLGLIDAHCSEPNGTTRTFDITGGAETVVRFVVTCNAITGQLSLKAVTTGAHPDLNGYNLALDGVPSTSIGANLSGVGWLRLTPGIHTITVSGVASHCTLLTPITTQYTIVVAQEVVDTIRADCP